jgi:hypothetical protein
MEGRITFETKCLFGITFTLSSQYQETKETSFLVVVLRTSVVRADYYSSFVYATHEYQSQ